MKGSRMARGKRKREVWVDAQLAEMADRVVQKALGENEAGLTASSELSAEALARLEATLRIDIGAIREQGERYVMVYTWINPELFGLAEDNEDELPIRAMAELSIRKDEAEGVEMTREDDGLAFVFEDRVGIALAARSLYVEGFIRGRVATELGDILATRPGGRR